MAYRLKLKTTLALEVRRIALEQIEIARVALARSDDRASAVHDARRSLKRLRAMLRLVRPALGETWFKQSNRQLASLGQRLSLSRDLDVMVVTLSKLENGAGGLPKPVADRLRGAVARSRSKADGASTPGSDRGLGRALQRAQTLFAGERLKGIALGHVAAGLEQSYRKARRTFRAAYEAGTDEAFHNWRKATQAHWRHMQLLGRGWPESIGARAAEAKELSRLLGEDHDLSVLISFAQGSGGSGLARADRDALTSACFQGQRQIRAVARLHGERLFADRPSHLTKRILRYWKAAEQLSTLVPPPDGDAQQRPPLPPSARTPPGGRVARVSARAAAGKHAARRRSRRAPAVDETP
jgi:CHAD domain-containing protein